MVFQEHALFPHLTVHGNVSFGLRHQNRAARKARVADLLSLFGITHLADRYPHQISGGQIQRVGIARALAPHPKLLLLDEPFNNLDSSLRETILNEVRAALKETATSALCITHIPHEAFAIADRIAVLEHGTIIQYCEARELYSHPINRYVAQFFGTINVLSAHYHNTHLVFKNNHTLALSAEHTSALGTPTPHQRVELLIRPNDIEFFPTESEVYCNRRDMLLLKGEIASTRYYGYYQVVQVRAIDAFPNREVTVHTDPSMTLATDQTVQIGLPLRKMRLETAANTTL